VQVQAVDDRGLEALLKELGVADRLGKDARCARCGDLVSLETIETVYPEEGKVKLICNNAKCATALVTPDDR
jgi:recombinational DNA repair protein (RecF pathway)